MSGPVKNTEDASLLINKKPEPELKKDNSLSIDAACNPVGCCIGVALLIAGSSLTFLLGGIKTGIICVTSGGMLGVSAAAACMGREGRSSEKLPLLLKQPDTLLSDPASSAKDPKRVGI